MATNLTGNLLPYNQELGTYFQNNLRTDLLKVPSPLGYGVPMSPLSCYRFMPRFSPVADLCAAQVANAGQLLTFNTTSPCYVAQSVSFEIDGTAYSSNGYMQFDWLRCIDIIPSGNVTAASAAIVTLLGFDDRGILVSEKLTSAANGAGGTTPLISNKSYYGLLGIVSQSFGNAITLTVNCDNLFFGMAYYSAQSPISTQVSDQTTNSQFENCSTIPAQNFRKIIPNNTPTVYGDSVNPNVAFQNTTVGHDARGLFWTTIGSIINNNNAVYRVVHWNAGADSLENALINRPLLNGNNLTQTVTQYCVSGNPYVNPPTMLSNPTQLTPFDIFGAQYPGDKILFNQTFQNVPNWKMV